MGERPSSDEFPRRNGEREENNGTGEENRCKAREAARENRIIGGIYGNSRRNRCACPVPMQS